MSLCHITISISRNYFLSAYNSPFFAHAGGAYIHVNDLASVCSVASPILEFALRQTAQSKQQIPNRQSEKVVELEHDAPFAKLLSHRYSADDNNPPDKLRPVTGYLPHAERRVDTVNDGRRWLPEDRVLRPEEISTILWTYGRLNDPSPQIFLLGE